MSDRKTVSLHKETIEEIIKLLGQSPSYNLSDLLSRNDAGEIDRLSLLTEDYNRLVDSIDKDDSSENEIFNSAIESRIQEAATPDESWDVFVNYLINFLGGESIRFGEIDLANIQKSSVNYVYDRIGWREHYRKHNLIALDPSVVMILRRERMFFTWSDLRQKYSQDRDWYERFDQLMGHAAQFGLTEGYVIFTPTVRQTFAVLSITGKDMPGRTRVHARLELPFLAFVAKVILPESISFERMTSSQLETLKLLLEGLTLAQMNTKTGLSVSALEKRIRRLHAKIGTKTPFQLGYYVRDKGLL